MVMREQEIMKSIWNGKDKENRYIAIRSETWEVLRGLAKNRILFGNEMTANELAEFVLEQYANRHKHELRKRDNLTLDCFTK